MKSIAVRVKGTVQGVGFRAFVSRQAEDLDLKGIVKNETDGSVYIEVEGEDQAIEALINKCKKGPAWATVSDINISEKEPGNYSGFRVVR